MRKFVLVLALLALATASYATAPASIVWSDSFGYADGALLGNGGWATASSPNSNISVVGGQVQMLGGGGSQWVTNTLGSVYTPGTGEIDLHFGITSVQGASTLWNVRVLDAGGLNIARFYGTGSTCRGRIGDLGVVTGQPNLAAGVNDLDIKILSTGTSEFFQNGTSIGVLNWASNLGGSTFSVSAIKFEVGNAATGDNVLLDNMSLGTVAVPEPSSLAALGMFGIGLIGTIRRRRS